MPEIVFTRPRVVEIPGMAHDNDNAVAAALCLKCQLIAGTPAGVVPNPAGGADPLGVALEQGGVAETFGYGTNCEIAGFDPTGLNPYDIVGPSLAVPGGMATGDERVPGVKVGRITYDLGRIKIRTT